MVTQEEAIGAMLGTFTGDALGMPYVGRSHSNITSIEMKPGRGRSAGSYTDDTQMAIATAKSLLECEGIDRKYLAKEYARHYQADRGYGSNTREVFLKWNRGQSIDEAAGTLFDGEGSFGNGGAMRIAPVSVCFGGDFEELDEAVEKVVSLTHTHPLGLGGALLQARAVETALQEDSGDGLDREKFLETVFDSFPSKYDPDGVYKEQKEIVREFLSDSPSREAVVSHLGNVSYAHKSVMTAVFSFLSNPSDFESAVKYTVSLGGDADTIGAMTGAISGAYLGFESIPDFWWECLENGEDGRDEVVILAKKLFENKRYFLNNDHLFKYEDESETDTSNSESEHVNENDCSGFSIDDWNDFVDAKRQFVPLPADNIIEGVLGKDLTKDQYETLKKGTVPAVYPGARWFQVYEDQTVIIGRISGECVYRVNVVENEGHYRLQEYQLNPNFEEFHEDLFFKLDEEENGLECLINMFLLETREYRHPG